MFDEPCGMSTEEIIRMAKDAENLSIHQGFLKAYDRDKHNCFEILLRKREEKFWEQLLSFEYNEREEKILSVITANEADTLRFTRFNSKKSEVEEYVRILQKLLKAGCFDENERQKQARKDWEEREKNFGKKVL